jgi:nitrilase
VVQASPVVVCLHRTLEKVDALAGEASAQSAKLVIFPEAFVSGYPRGLDFGSVVGSRTEAGRDEFLRYWESSVAIPGPAFTSLA